MVVDEETVSAILFDSNAGSSLSSMLKNIVVGASVLRTVGFVGGSRLVDGLVLGRNVG